MCGRYFLEESPELRPIVEAMNRSPLMPAFGQQTGMHAPYGEIRPTAVVPVIASNRRGEQTVFPMKWGYTGKSLLINAKTETASLKPTFRDGWAHHRCVIPASWYFEWEHQLMPDGKMKTGAKYLLRPRNAVITWLCGLYRLEAGLPCFVILTRAPVDSIRFIHDRMPLMLPDSAVGDWIRPETDPAELLSSAQTDMDYEKAI